MHKEIWLWTYSRIFRAHSVCLANVRRCTTLVEKYHIQIHVERLSGHYLVVECDLKEALEKAVYRVYDTISHYVYKTREQEPRFPKFGDDVLTDNYKFMEEAVKEIDSFLKKNKDELY